MPSVKNAFRFDERVVLVTGGSRGLGKAFCKLFAKHGAKIVINSQGGMDVDQPSVSAAEVTRREIEAVGGSAVVIERSVCDAESIINFCIEQYGRLDVVVHNAGIVNDASFAKQDFDAWNKVYQVHLEAAYKLCHTVWPIFKSQQYGRLLFIGSSAGLYGNFGQANYSAAKMGLLGLSNTLAVEGARYNILSNCVAPIATTQMNENILTQEQKKQFRVEDVAPLIGYLCHESSDENGGLFEAGGGWFSKVRLQRSLGAALIPGEIQMSDIAGEWGAITDFSTSEAPTSIGQSLDFFQSRLKS